MNRDIPGFYYDSVKRRYFRIEKSQTAPSQAEWSARNVKRRAAEQAEEEKRRARLRRDAQKVRRARVETVPLMGGLLARETGMSRRGDGVGSGDEVVARAWAGSLAEKGEVRLWPSVGVGLDYRTVSAMWVGGGVEDDGLGIVCGVLERLWPSSSFIPRDADDRINFQFAAGRYPRVGFQPRIVRELTSQGGVTAIKCHEPSSRILLAYESFLGGVGIWQFRVRAQEGGAGLVQLLRGGIDGLDPYFASLGNGSAFTIRALQPAPPSSRLTCLVGTDRGIAQLHNDALTLLTPPPRQGQRHPHRRRRQPCAPDPDAPPWQGDVLSVDFLHQNSADTVLAGTRSGRVCLLDLRVPPRQWSARSNTFRHPSSTAHVRSVGAYHVLAAGPLDAMALYDVRFLRQRRQQHRQQQTLPLFTFPAYRNAAHLCVGLDVLTEPGYGGGGGGGGGIVAAAHATNRADDRGTVALYSLRDGSRISGAAVDAVRAPGVVQSLQWQTLPGDRHPSLFVGEGPVVRKYSFWA
ncbi:hypothetical protein MYCTH_2070868 [Thermothelomyces thermophilus ATCC 42464]|uniref:Myocyte-specific enhancer factor 2d n=1 Tax=Thermothelomyces thermophilus (strain ATCC 42464 / BCRC 31852 / DSM 1799) TaxID=573729 RepID=G2QN06_THET4|nr:uncharacterized protein MYCTH_2070868 [Thermothelomyces thermophilus ATCC 42464]AEO61879.1 hypothetical protein MYCTH_2070868 [Thermothelomyces thermophilus ATCC 42464]